MEYKEDDIWGFGAGGFYFHKQEWKHYAVFLWHEKWSDGYFIGVSWFNPEPQQKLKTNKLDCLSGKTDSNWPYGFDYLDKYRHWDAYTAVDMINGKFTKAITDYVVKIIKEIEDKGLPML